MTLLLGAFTALIVQLEKYLVGKIGYELTNFLILFSVFCLALALAYGNYAHVISGDLVKNVAIIFASAVATYQVILKPLLPAYDLVFGKK
jgi:hypothetical protein